MTLSQASDPSFDSTLDSDHLSASVPKGFELLQAGPVVHRKIRAAELSPCWRLYVALQPSIVAYGGDGHHRIALVRSERAGACSEDFNKRQEGRSSSTGSHRQCTEGVGNLGRNQEEAVQES
jgi:hypothetical protein